MKHNFKITIILISMFLITQLIGLYIVGFYNSEDNALPYGFEPPSEIKPISMCDNAQTSLEYIKCSWSLLFPILIAFVIAIGLFFLLTKINAEKIIRVWFFIIIILSISLSFNVILSNLNINYYPALIAILIALPLAYFKVFKRNLLVHNLTELIIYPGIAAVLVSILNILTTIILLLAISLWDIWAVWHSEVMQKMAKYQMNKVKVFAGFFVPYANKKEKQKIKQIKQKYKENSGLLEKHFKNAKIKISLAILGGGDVVFPIIAAGVFIKTFNSLLPGLILAGFATMALLFLFILARKGKFYPAMPFITIGLYLGMILNWLLIGLGVI